MNNGKNLLIVDDEPGMLATLKYIFEDEGYTVITAEDGNEAIEWIRKNDINLILMDIKMPGLNGVDTFKRIKQVKPSIKVIMMTAYTTDELVQQSINEGVYSVVYKPLNIDVVLSLIKGSG